MKGIQYLSDLRTILTKSKNARDTRIENSFLLSRVNIYRGEAIRQSHRRSGVIDPAWLQATPAITVFQSTTSDLPGTMKSTKPVGKFTLPAIVSLDGNLGLFRVATLSNEVTYNPVNLNEFILKLKADEHSIMHKFGFVSQFGQQYFVRPYVKSLRAFIIYLNPLEGYVLQEHTPLSGSLVYTTSYQEGEQYRVTAGMITHNGIQYTLNQTFTAVNPNYTGNGTIEHVNKQRKLTLEDEYPMSSDIAEEVFLKILMKDFALEKKEVAEIRNDAVDELHVMQEKMS